MTVSERSVSGLWNSCSKIHLVNRERRTRSLSLLVSGSSTSQNFDSSEPLIFIYIISISPLLYLLHSFIYTLHHSPTSTPTSTPPSYVYPTPYIYLTVQHLPHPPTSAPLSYIQPSLIFLHSIPIVSLSVHIELPYQDY